MDPEERIRQEEESILASVTAHSAGLLAVAEAAAGVVYTESLKTG